MAAIARLSPWATAPYPVAYHVLLPNGDMRLVSLVDYQVRSKVLTCIDLADKIAVTSWISVAILPLCVFLLVSYAVLPVKWSHRHYLSVCFTVGICFMQVS